MDHGKEGVCQLGETLSLNSWGVDALDPVNKSWPFREQGPVIVHPDVNTPSHQAFAEFFDHRVVSPIDVGIAFSAHNGDLQFFFRCCHRWILIFSSKASKLYS